MTGRGWRLAGAWALGAVVIVGQCWALVTDSPVLQWEAVGIPVVVAVVLLVVSVRRRRRPTTTHDGTATRTLLSGMDEVQGMYLGRPDVPPPTAGTDRAVASEQLDDRRTADERDLRGPVVLPERPPTGRRDPEG